MILSPVVLIIFNSTLISGKRHLISDLIKLACHKASWLPLVPIYKFFFMKFYATPHEEQLEDEQLPHPEEADDLTWVSLPGPDDFDINPQADISRDRSWLSQKGHSGLELPITRVSNFLSQALHLYSYIGIN